MQPRERRIAEAVAVAALLGLHFWLAFSSAREKSAGFDEIAHLGGGYLQSTLGDYRFNAESGTLPQRWAALPLVTLDLGVPPADHPARRSANVWVLGRELVYGEGSDAERLLVAGRGMIALFSLALAGLVYIWSRACHGPGGAFLSLGLYALSPTMLAHARLITADMAAAFFFLLSVGALWLLLERTTPARLAGAAVATSGLLLSKMSGVLILPMAAALILIRLVQRRMDTVVPLGRQALRIAVLAMAVAVFAIGAIWSAYGWRYAAQPEAAAEGSQFLHTFDALLERDGLTTRVLGVARDARLLPESYLWGLAYTLDTTRERDAFLRGETRRTGWWWFFPYAVMVKTPLALFGLLGLTAARRGTTWRASNLGAPLWVLLAIYSAVAISSHINIGHRHMLPIYAVLFIFAGGAVRWLSHGWTRTLLGLCLAAFAWESVKIRPHYLSYFNQFAGGPQNGYRHLVDSSLDWGQDLPELARSLAELRATGSATFGKDAPIYIAYFGAAPPAYYGVDARWLYSFFPVANPSRPPVPLTGGVYCVSATLLQSMHIEMPGPWTEDRERAFRQRREQVKRLLEGERAIDDPGQIFQPYRRLRSARLFAFLRQREPDTRVGYSIHCYRLSDADVDRALNAPL